MNRAGMGVVALFSVVAMGYPQTFYRPPPPPGPGWCAPPGVVSIRYGLPNGYYYVCALPPRPEVTRGQLTPTLYATHVVYAVPGRSSSMAYSRGDRVGSSTSSTHSWKNGVTVEFSAGANVFFAGGQLSLQFGQDWGSTAKGTVDVTVEHSNGYRKLGEADHVDHDSDEVWFLMNQTLDIAVTPDSVWGPGKVEWGFSADAPGVPYFLYAAEIRGSRPIPPGVQETLNRYGVTPDDIMSLADLDPFIWDPTKNPAADPARFELLWTGPYRPASSPTAPASSQSYQVTRRLTNTIEQSAEQSNTTTLKVGADLSFLGLMRSTLSFSDRFTFSYSTSTRNSLETNSANTLTVGQPSYGYAGPTVLRVYEDKIWKTYVFHLDWGAPAALVGSVDEGGP